MASDSRLKKRVNARLSADEFAMLKANAQALGTTVSGLVRILISVPFAIVEHDDSKTVETVSENPRLVVIHKGEISALIRQIRAWGYHYNQAVHALNVIQSKRFLTQDETREYLDSALEKLDAINNATGPLLDSAQTLATSQNALVPTAYKTGK